MQRRLNLSSGYGSLQNDTIEGKLFELDTYARVLKKQTMYYFVFVIAGALFWPLAILSVPLWPVVWCIPFEKWKSVQMFGLIMSLAVITGIAFWAVPVLCLSLGGGMPYVWHLLDTHQVSTLDISSCFTDQILLLLAIMFSWVYHEVSLDLCSVKDGMMQKLSTMDHGWGCHVVVPQEQVENVRNAAATTCLSMRRPRSSKPPSRKSSLSSRSDDKDCEVPLYLIMCILEELMPGWQSGADDVNDHLGDLCGKPWTLKTMLDNGKEVANAKGLTRLDVFLTREQWRMPEEMSIWKGLLTVYGQTKDWFHMAWASAVSHPEWALAILVIATIRTSVPRLWLRFGLGGVLFPADTAANILVFGSGLITFGVTLFWCAIFVTVLLEYRRNTCQVNILGALVEPRQRVSYVENFLMNSYRFNMGAEEAEDVLAKLPLLSLKEATNVAAFWKLRDYVVLDRANDRMAMSVFLEILIIWLVIKFLMTVAVTYILQTFSPFLIVTLFDVMVFGALLVYSLSIALKINNLTDMHRRVLVETRQRVVLDMAAADFGHASGRDNSPEMQSLRSTRKLLAECEEIIKECDHRDRILMEMDVTPGKVVSVAATIGGAVYTLMAKMLTTGFVNAPKMDFSMLAGGWLQFAGVLPGVSSATHPSHFLQN